MIISQPSLTEWNPPPIGVFDKGELRSRHQKGFELKSYTGSTLSLLSALNATWEVSHFPLSSPTVQAKKAIDLLNKWLNEDSDEHHQSWEYLKEALNKYRLSDRKFFS